MSYNGKAPKCQCLYQLPKHAASLQSKTTSTSDTVPLPNARDSYFHSTCNLALGDTEGIFKQALKNNLNFSPRSFVPLKSTAFLKKNKNKKLLVLSKIWSRHCHSSMSNDGKTACAAACRWECTSWHAGQRVLTLKVNRWEALEETTVSFTSEKLGTHGPGIIGTGMQKRLRPR